MALHTNPKVRVRAFGKKKVTWSVPWEAIVVILFLYSFSDTFFISTLRASS